MHNTIRLSSLIGSCAIKVAAAARVADLRDIGLHIHTNKHKHFTMTLPRSPINDRRARNYARSSIRRWPGLYIT